MKAVHYHNLPRLKDGKMVNEIVTRKVSVLAIVDKYAMVRVDRGMPYVAPVKDLDVEELRPKPIDVNA